MSPVVCCLVVLWCLLLVPRLTEVHGRSLRIIVPHKINYIHHHHNPNGIKLKREFSDRPKIIHEHIYHEEEEEEEEPFRGYHLEDEGFDAVEEDKPFYAFAVPEYYENAVQKPRFSYNYGYRKWRPPNRYEEYLQRLRLPREPLRFGFERKPHRNYNSYDF